MRERKKGRKDKKRRGERMIREGRERGKGKVGKEEGKTYEVVELQDPVTTLPEGALRDA